MPAGAEIEILLTCPAKRLQRTGEMRQWGVVFTTAGSKFPTSRRGVLHWSALDATCPTPDGHVRFEAGPFYAPGSQHGARLFNWAYSYTKMRLPHEHPEEWVDLGTQPARTSRGLE